jgi:hypothetical protein
MPSDAGSKPGPSGMFAALSFGGLAFVLAWILPAPLAGQATHGAADANKKTMAKPWAPLLTHDGKPDLQGTWMNRSATPLERPKQLEGRRFLTDAEVKQMQKRSDQLFNDGSSDYLDSDTLFDAVLARADIYKDPTGPLEGNDVTLRLEFDNRTSLIVDPPDGKLPPYTLAGKQRREARDALDTLKNPPASPKDLAPYQRCIVNGVPAIGGNSGSYFQIVQTRDYIVIAMENIHETRIIPLDGRPHLSPSVRQWDGDSVGHWEGKTLVVDTTNFTAFNPFYGSVDGLHLIERFTRVAGDEIRQEITVEDAATWTKPWTAVQRLKQTKERIFEVACHEGNAPVMEDMLSGAVPTKTKH